MYISQGWDLRCCSGVTATPSKTHHPFRDMDETGLCRANLPIQVLLLGFAFTQWRVFISLFIPILHTKIISTRNVLLALPGPSESTSSMPDVTGNVSESATTATEERKNKIEAASKASVNCLCYH